MVKVSRDLLLLIVMLGGLSAPLVLGSGTSAATNPERACTLMLPPPGLRAEAAVLAVATAEWSSVSGELHPFQEFWLSKFYGLSLRVEGDRLVQTEESVAEAQAVARMTVPGQEFVVIATHPAAQLDLGSGSRITVVPWGHSPSCSYGPFDKMEWVTPGDTVVFQLESTRESDEPIFDVSATLEPYPTYVWSPPERRADGSLADGWLSPAQYWTFLNLLPRPLDQLSPVDQRAVERTVLEWARTNELRESWPLRRWLEWHSVR